MKPGLPPREKERLEAVHRYNILDSTPEKEYDDLTLLASHICETPIAMITLIDEKRQWFKSKIGHDISETDRNLAFCAHGILHAEVLVIKDTLQDERTSDNPFVTQYPKIRFYAGAPLKTADGHTLGTICVNDLKPRQLSPQQITALEALSRQVMAQLELRRSATDLRRTVNHLTRTQEELRGRRAFLEAVVNESIDGILVVDSNGRKVLQNRRMNELWKIPKHIACNDDDQRQVAWVTEMTKDPGTFAQRVHHLYQHPKESGRDEIELRDGTILDRYSSPVLGRDGDYYGRVWSFHDITERKALDALLFQSQKLETVGKLAGGIAHEFNSILTAIIGHSELLLGDLDHTDSRRHNVEEIRQASQRASTLTRQLLAYGRKQMLQPEVLDLNTVLLEMTGTLRHLVGNQIEIRIVPGKNLKAVRIDPCQMEQVIVNLVMNAADAMPNGGKLVLETSNMTLDENYVQAIAGLKPGAYVMLALSDTGAGMSAEVKARLFEPFFSTKGVGRGTGLGLAACYGIIKQSDGHLSVYSEVARGSTFRVYLPQVEPPTKKSPTISVSADLPGGSETILLAENDPSLLEMSSMFLRRLGYTVHTAVDGVEAMTLRHREETGHIDLLFSDIVMPNMSGKELSDRIRAAFPKTKILLTSAHSELCLTEQGLGEGVVLLPKPYTPSTLARKVRDTLDQKN